MEYMQKRVVRFVFLKLFSGATEYHVFSVAPEKNLKSLFSVTSRKRSGQLFFRAMNSLVKRCFDGKNVPFSLKIVIAFYACYYSDM